MFDFNKAIEILTSKLEGWGTTFIKMLPNLVIAIFIVVAFWLIARLVRKLAEKVLARITDNKSLINLMTTIIYVLVIGVGTFTALSLLHLDKAVTSLLAGVGIVGLALGFAFQDMAANFVSGILIATRKPYKLGDLIETKGYQGHIVDMNLRSTTVRTFQGQDVIIPNKDLFQNPLINYASYPKRRIDLEVGVSYGDDLRLARTVAIKAIESLDILDTSKPVDLFYTSFGDSSINFSVRYWVDECEQPKFLEAQSEGVIAIKDAFDENDITIPFPIRTMDFGVEGGLALSEVPLKVRHKESA